MFSTNSQSFRAAQLQTNVLQPIGLETASNMTCIYFFRENWKYTGKGFWIQYTRVQNIIYNHHHARTHDVKVIYSLLYLFPP
jgi:hypothetical protein